MSLAHFAGRPFVFAGGGYFRLFPYPLRPEVVFVPEFSTTALRMLLLGKRFGFRVISFCDDSLDMIRGNDFSLKHRFARQWLPRFLDGVITLSPSVSQWYRNRFGLDPLWMPLIVDERRMRPDLERVLPRSEFIRISKKRAVRQGSLKYYGWVVFLFLVLFIAQNRTSLLAAIFVLGYVLFSMKMSSRKLIMMTVLFLSTLLMFMYTADQWKALYFETLDQLNNPEYNRIKSLVYMVGSRNYLRYLLGDGFISADVNPIIHILQESGIDHSDVGLLGLWHQFGVIPVLTVLIITFKGFSRQKSFLVKASAIYTLTGIVTLSYFAFGETLLWFSCYLYLYYASSSPQFQEPLYKKRTVQYNYHRPLAVS